MTVRRVARIRPGTADVVTGRRQNDGPVFGIRRSPGDDSDDDSVGSDSGSSDSFVGGGGGYPQLRRPATTHLGGWRTNKSSVLGLRKSPTPREQVYNTTAAPATAPSYHQVSPMMATLPASTTTTTAAGYHHHQSNNSGGGGYYQNPVAPPPAHNSSDNLYIPQSILKRMQELESGQQEAENRLAEAQRELKQIELREQYFENLRKRGIEPPTSTTTPEQPGSHVIRPSSQAVVPATSSVKSTGPPTLGYPAARPPTSNPTFNMKDLTPPNLPSSCFSESVPSNTSTSRTYSVPASSQPLHAPPQQPQPQVINSSNPPSYSAYQAIPIHQQPIIPQQMMPPPPQQRPIPPQLLHHHMQPPPQPIMYPPPTRYAPPPAAQAPVRMAPPPQPTYRYQSSVTSASRQQAQPLLPPRHQWLTPSQYSSRPMPILTPGRSPAPPPPPPPPHVAPYPQYAPVAHRMASSGSPHPHHIAIPRSIIAQQRTSLSTSGAPIVLHRQIPVAPPAAVYPQYVKPSRPVLMSPRQTWSAMPTTHHIEEDPFAAEALSPRHRAMVGGVDPPLVTVGGMQLPKGAEVTPNSEGFLTIERTPGLPSVGSKKKKRSCGC